ncbi:hypothetical protein CSAL01_12859 [Colletotrichum salicis]|uniref:Uncharacterized protein n=1 Tax=Colletotrichum salicis TaxID=1209931 RepID=A0A135TEN1_9PEZI|nr:hypothetical protein CSAL01_12859 [Colletotrichum salicis]
MPPRASSSQLGYEMP